MTTQHEVYRCPACGNIVEVKHAGGGELVCCGKPMQLLRANTQDAATEKHVPHVERTQDGIVVRVGDVAHPMDEDHYIEWITLVSANKTKTVYLEPGDEPMALFSSTAEKVTAYAYCNLHGLWKKEVTN